MALAAGSLVEAAPAKINLALHVTGLRADGYHLLDTLAVFTEAGDRVTAESEETDRFTVSGLFASALPPDSTNLVLRARDLFFETFTGRVPLGITLEKCLPISSGIGGGSSDAAAVLRALSRLFRFAARPEALAAVGLRLGADVPMCLHSRPLRASGIGEQIAALENFPALPLLLVNPGVAVSTPAVFKALWEKNNSPLPPLPPNPDFAAVCGWLGQTRNDLQAPAVELAPTIGDALRALRQSGAAFARMSGSGATCFGLFASTAETQRAADIIRRAEPAWWVCPTRTTPSDGTAPDV